VRFQLPYQAHAELHAPTSRVYAEAGGGTLCLDAAEV
jgi:hypothetical protein